MVVLYVLIFLASCLLLAFSSRWLVKSLTRIAKFLGWREFVVAFVIMAFASSIPNLFVDITSALKKIPELAFGEIVGGNVIDLTLVIALAALFAKMWRPGKKPNGPNFFTFYNWNCDIAFSTNFGW